MNAQDFIRHFVHDRHATYVDLGNHDFGVSDDEVYVRDKLSNEVTRLDRRGLEISHAKRVSPSYYIAAVGLLVMAFYFSVFFMRDALEDDIWIVALLGIYLSPFIFRRLTSGFKVIGLYFALCTIFALTVGSWQDNQLGSGVLIFFVIGIVPYVASKVFARIWTESDLVLSSEGRQLKLRIEEAKVGPLMRALGTQLST